MWIRMRLDIGWRDLLAGFAHCVFPGQRSTAVEHANQAWSCQQDFLITLSVRSAFDLTLRALQLPPGSEVLLSALTVPGIVRIVKSHGLIPVPVDVDDGSPNLLSIKRAISPQTKMIVVAHLFGGTACLDDVIEVARQNNLLVVEDCAQSFNRVGDSGHPDSDIAMFSFGPIKTASALGGAVVRVSSPGLRKRMAESQKRDPIQSRVSFARRIARFALLKLFSGNLGAALFRRSVECVGYDFDSMANSIARGFGSADLIVQIRRQPATPLLRLLRRRWRTYDFTRIERRTRLGRQLDRLLGQEHATSHSYWVYPVLVNDPNAVRDRLCAAGFDATSQTRMMVVPAINDSSPPTSALCFWKHMLFLPWYPELSQDAVEKMAKLVSLSDRKTVLATPPTEQYDVASKQSFVKDLDFDS